MTDERDDHDAGSEESPNELKPVPSQQDHKANADAGAAASPPISGAPSGDAPATDERHDTNLDRVRRWFTQQPDEGREETAREPPAPLHPKRDLMAIAEVAAAWLSECASSKHETNSIHADLFELVTEGQSDLIGGLFDKTGNPQDVFGAAFDYYARDGLYLSLGALRRLCETPDGQTWCRKWGLPDRPKFLYGDQELNEKDRPSPPKYDWPEFAAEVVRIADTDGLPIKSWKIGARRTGGIAQGKAPSENNLRPSINI